MMLYRPPPEGPIFLPLQKNELHPFFRGYLTAISFIAYTLFSGKKSKSFSLMKVRKEGMADSSDRKTIMAEIARMAEVSVPTVSKVLNQYADVAPATRQRVERIIKERGYVVNKAARALRKGQSGQVDLMVPGLNALEFEIIRGVKDALETTDFRLTLSIMGGKEARVKNMLAKVLSDSTDGVVMLLVADMYAPIQELRQCNIPFVVIDTLNELTHEIPSIGAINVAGGKNATSYLLSLGHRRIAFISGPTRFTCIRERLLGYRTALEEAGISLASDLILHGDFSVESGYEQTKSLLALPEPPTAIFAAADTLALGAYHFLYERNLRIPDTMSIVGFDDLLLSSHAIPPLTTVRQPLLEMGRSAVSMLLRLIANEQLEVVRAELATPLIKRASCAPPRTAPLKPIIAS